MEPEIATGVSKGGDAERHLRIPSVDGTLAERHRQHGLRVVVPRGREFGGGPVAVTRVVNKYKEPFDVYIGRPSIFGNPYKIGKATREEVVLAYSIYFDMRINKDEKFRKAVEALRGKRLGCYCKPLPCHGDVIVDWLETKSK